MENPIDENISNISIFTDRQEVEENSVMINETRDM
jgi:hypothetical protein